MLVSPALVSSPPLPTLLLYLGNKIQLTYRPDLWGFQKGHMVQYLCVVLTWDVLVHSESDVNESRRCSCSLPDVQETN